jgi:hypothetical protein
MEGLPVLAEPLMARRAINEHATNEQIKIDGQPLSVQTVKYTDTVVSVPASLLRSPPAFSEGEFHSVICREFDELCDEPDEEALSLTQGHL